MSKDDDFELVRGSGNAFRDLNLPNPELEQLRSILKHKDKDLKHLAKATYYVSDADASGKLNELRPKFYDPQRPPAASKAMVNGVGMKDRSISIDMIGVVATDAPAKTPVKP